MDPILLASARELAAQIRTRVLTSESVVKAHIDQINKTHHRVFALVENRFEDALREARSIDQALDENSNHRSDAKLLGVPCTIKEMFAVEGFLQTGGLKSRENGPRAKRDHVLVERLRDHGAVVLGTTNVSELGMWIECSNRIYPTTNNAYHPAHTAGGSSGGEGAIIASGGSPFGLGSDIGGSVRIPSFFNGIFGLKPTGGSLPNDNVFPHPGAGLERVLCSGPMARRAEDLVVLFEVLQCKPMKKDPAKIKLSELRGYFALSNQALDPEPSLKEAQRSAIEDLKKVCRVDELQLPEFKKSLVYWMAKLEKLKEKSFKEQLFGAQTSTLKGLLGCRNHHTFPALALVGLEAAFKFPQKWQDKWFIECEALAEKLNRILGEEGFLVFPSYPRCAPKHHHAKLVLGGWAYTALFNALELPVVQVPLGLNSKGLPLGCQIVAAKHQEANALAVALHLETSFGGWQPPPMD